MNMVNQRRACDKWQKPLQQRCTLPTPVCQVVRVLNAQSLATHLAARTVPQVVFAKGFELNELIQTLRKRQRAINRVYTINCSGVVLL